MSMTKEEVKEKMLTVLRRDSSEGWQVRSLCDLIDEIMDQQEVKRTILQDTPQPKGTPVFPKDFSPDEIMAERTRLEKAYQNDGTRRRMGYYDLIGDIADAYRNSGFVKAVEVKAYPANTFRYCAPDEHVDVLGDNGAVVGRVYNTTSTDEAVKIVAQWIEGNKEND